MSENKLNELNNFLKTGGRKEVYLQRLKDNRDKLYKNEKIRMYINAYAIAEEELLGRPREECFDYIYKLLTLFITEGLLEVSKDK